MLYHIGVVFFSSVCGYNTEALGIGINLFSLPYPKTGNKVHGLESFLFQVKVREADCLSGPCRRSCLNQWKFWVGFSRIIGNLIHNTQTQHPNFKSYILLFSYGMLRSFHFTSSWQFWILGLVYSTISYWYTCNLVHLREERKLRVFENMELWRIFGPRRDEVTGNGGDCISRS